MYYVEVGNRFYEKYKGLAIVGTKKIHVIYCSTSLFDFLGEPLLLTLDISVAEGLFY